MPQKVQLCISKEQLSITKIIKKHTLQGEDGLGIVYMRETKDGLKIILQEKHH
jgi:hypothetical protein